MVTLRQSTDLTLSVTLRESIDLIFSQSLPLLVISLTMPADRCKTHLIAAARAPCDMMPAFIVDDDSSSDLREGSIADGEQARQENEDKLVKLRVRKVVNQCRYYLK